MLQIGSYCFISGVLCAPQLFLPTYIISIYLGLRFWNKWRKGKRLSPLEKSGTIIGIVTGVIGTIISIIPLVTNLSVNPLTLTVTTLWAILLGIIAIEVALPILIVRSIYLKRQKRKAIDLFEIKVTPEKTFVVGETFLVQVKFKGKLRNGLIEPKIITPFGDSFNPLFNQELHSDEDGEDGKGHIRGYRSIDSGWTWTIPLNFPEEKYSIVCDIYDYYDGPYYLLAWIKKELIDTRTKEIKVVRIKEDKKSPI